MDKKLTLKIRFVSLQIVCFITQEKLPFPYDLERIIDDWILMGFLVGNDFIPHLPNLHINHVSNHNFKITKFIFFA